jgi:hypothetical protein
VHERGEPRAVAHSLLQSRYPGAELVLLAGSVVRGEGTDFSDLDLVVVFRELDHAWRESLVSEGWPIEAFVHDPATLEYFFAEVDAPDGIPSLARMVLEGIPLPAASQLSDELKARAQCVLAAGPPALSDEQLAQCRYNVTDLVDDLRASRTREEQIATAAALYAVLGDFHLRTRGKWSATGKTIPRALGQDDPDVAHRFAASFETLFARATRFQQSNSLSACSRPTAASCSLASGVTRRRRGESAERIGHVHARSESAWSIR